MRYVNNFQNFILNQRRSKSSALSSAERDQISRGANLFLAIALNELSTLVEPIKKKYRNKTCNKKFNKAPNPSTLSHNYIILFNSRYTVCLLCYFEIFSILFMTLFIIAIGISCRLLCYFEIFNISFMSFFIAIALINFLFFPMLFRGTLTEQIYIN